MPYKSEKKVLRVEEEDLIEFQMWQDAVNTKLTTPVSQAKFFAMIVEAFGPQIRKWVGIR
jgi:hypothetical protein